MLEQSTLENLPNVFPPKDAGYIWLVLFLESFRDEMRLEGKWAVADKMRQVLESQGCKIKDVPLYVLRDFKKEYAKHRGMAGAALWELEMF